VLPQNEAEPMTPELSPELHQALAASPDGPLEVVDPVSKKAYVLVSASAYERVRELLETEADVVQDMTRYLANLSPEDWEDADNYETR